METLGTIFGVILFLVGIPFIGYVSIKNEFGGGMYNKKDEKKKKP